MKITPEIKRFIYDNSTLTSRALSGLIEQKFQIKVSYVSVDAVLQKARADKASDNNAKVEAVREAVLDDAQRYAGKYLDILDREIDAWDNLLTTGIQTFPKKEGEPEAAEIYIKDVKDRSTASQSLQKCIGMVLEFAKPAENPNVNVTINEDVTTRVARYKAYFEGLKDESNRGSDKVPGRNGSG